MRIGRKVYLFEDGMMLAGFPGASKSIPWTSVAQICVTTHLEELPLSSGLLRQVAPKRRRHVYQFTLHNASMAEVEEEDLQYNSTFPKVLGKIAGRKSILWEERDIDAS
jgi:hypothetical protein